jgi:hypothetical protein
VILSKLYQSTCSWYAICSLKYSRSTRGTIEHNDNNFNYHSKICYHFDRVNIYLFRFTHTDNYINFNDRLGQLLVNLNELNKGGCIVLLSICVLRLLSIQNGFIYNNSVVLSIASGKIIQNNRMPTTRTFLFVKDTIQAVLEIFIC